MLNFHARWLCLFVCFTPVVSAADPTPVAACDKDFQEIRSQFTLIPPTFSGHPAGQLKEANKRVHDLRGRAEAFIADCPSHAGLAETQFVLASLLLALNRTSWSDYMLQMNQLGKKTTEVAKQKPRWTEEYFGRIAQLARSGVTGLPKEHPLRARALDLLGDTLLQLKKPREALDRYKTLVQDYPDYPSMPSILHAMAGARLELEEFAAGIEAIRKGMHQFPRAQNFAYFYEWLWKLQLAAGDLQALRGLAHEMLQALPARSARKDATKAEQELTERSIGAAGFRKGYAHFALGENDAAIAAFKSHVETLEKTKAKLGGLPQDFAIYLERSKRNLLVLEQKIGRPAPADIGIATWQGERPKPQKGRPTAIVFRGRGDERSAPFLKAIDAHHRGKKELYDLVVLSYFRGEEPVGDQLATVAQDLGTLGVDCSAAMDPDEKGHSLFAAFEANVGTATFVVLDGEGRYAWYQQDPRAIDARFSIAVVERIAKGK